MSCEERERNGSSSFREESGEIDVSVKPKDKLSYVKLGQKLRIDDVIIILQCMKRYNMD